MEAEAESVGLLTKIKHVFMLQERANEMALHAIETSSFYLLE